jgi:serine/threonine-protein kinase
MTADPQPPARDAPIEPDPMLGRTLADRYRIDDLVARGGMARVYRARDERLERDVAVKVLAPPYSNDPEFVERFLAEARTAASISHPSLVHVYDSGSDGRAHFIVMELLDRHRTLREVLTEHGRLSVAEVGRIGTELLAGLRVVHERGLVHCDIKAANVMLGPGPAKLIDFGIARTPEGSVAGGTSMGTLSSMSPEQLAGEPLTPASDLFSLGTVLYEALTGRLPFPGTTPDDVRALHAAGEVVPPTRIVAEIPTRLEGLVLQSLHREPGARFRSAEAMARALAVATAEDPPDATPSSRSEEDETRVVPAVPPASAGYVPPPVAADRPAAAPSPAAAPPAAAPPAAPRAAHPVQPPPRRSPSRPPRRRRGAGGLLGTIVLLGLAALVVAFVVVPLVDLPDADANGTASPSSAAVATPAPTVAADLIPETIGLPAAEAIAVANEAGLNWVLECEQNDELPDGIIDQQPVAGTQVAPGSRFTMYSARIADCRGGEDDNSGPGNGNDD